MIFLKQTSQGKIKRFHYWSTSYGLEISKTIVFFNSLLKQFARTPNTEVQNITLHVRLPLHEY